MENLKLLMTLNEFTSQCDKFIEGGRYIENQVKQGDKVTETIKLYETWYLNVRNFFSTNFSSYFYEVIARLDEIRENGWINSNEKSGAHSNLDYAISRTIECIKYYRKLVPELSNVILPESGTWATKQLRTEDKLNFLLEKLYKLQGESYYSIETLLIGNGIEIRTEDEFLELSKILEKKDHVKADRDLKYTTDKMGIRLKITSKGALYVEGLLKKKDLEQKKAKSTKTKSDFDFKEMKSKIDRIYDEVLKQSDGQQIIYEELEELKAVLPHINKKGFGQFLKSKLVDLAAAEVINRDTAQSIFKDLTETALQLKNAF